METAVSLALVDQLNMKGVKFLLTRNFKGLDNTQRAVQKHKRAVKQGRERELILMAFQHDVLPDYTILAVKDYPLENELYKYGFYPVKKDRANWIPIQYINRFGKEHLKCRDGEFSHTTNHSYLPIEEVIEYLEMAEKVEAIYK